MTTILTNTETITVERNKTVYNDGLYPKTNHIILPNHYLKRLFTTDSNIQLVPFDKLRFYNSPPSEQLDQYTFRFYCYRNFLISPNSYIWFVDLLYPKEQILSLFDNKPLNNNYTELLQKIADQQATIDQQAKEIADLKAQLEQQATQPSDTATDDEILNYDEVKAIQAIKNEFWLDYDPKNKPVLKLVVTEWITQNYPSINPSMASWLDKIVRQKYVK